MGVALTVADSKRAFHQAFPYVIAPLHRRMVDELLVELHLLSRQQGFQADSLFACGLIQVFDGFAKGYKPEGHRQALLSALCSASGFDAQKLRQQAESAMAAMGEHSVDAVKQWVEQQGKGAPQPLASALASIQRPDFHYSRLMAVGLLCLLEQAQGADAMDQAALRSYAHDLGASMGFMRDRLDKDISLYATNLEKMAQAVELMEETLAADRRKRERILEESKAGAAAAASGEAASEGDPIASAPTAG
ncbi:photosystem II biogenesis protein Psp29 [Cyanobium sp. HWJ4-Hawea]|uniref:photosystem II biogenesis protein Psp29 n=1 Tax=Cyanobium sp. HWJ4-Hawea TaxID=2823713 RepID=UPI0020CB9B1E|nr:photosystem II biogenesis protein Psp29 [Cyanobium sp. HWJ4-Hawea]MCP9808408.1 photosystem II biogenesis protein Psp29 [Cyanobium sp. HWJ4-Hawea]